MLCLRKPKSHEIYYEETPSIGLYFSSAMITPITISCKEMLIGVCFVLDTRETQLFQAAVETSRGEFGKKSGVKGLRLGLGRKGRREGTWKMSVGSSRSVTGFIQIDKHFSTIITSRYVAFNLQNSPANILGVEVHMP